MKRLILVFFLLFFLFGCTDNTPRGIIAKDRMAGVLTDIHLVDGYAATLLPESAAVKTPLLYRSVFEKFKTDSVEFRKSVEYYSKKPDEFQQMYVTVNKNLETLLKQEQKLADARLKKKEKARLDSLKKDSINKKIPAEKKTTNKADSLKLKKQEEDANRKKQIEVQKRFKINRFMQRNLNKVQEIKQK